MSHAQLPPPSCCHLARGAPYTRQAYPADSKHATALQAGGCGVLVSVPESAWCQQAHACGQQPAWRQRSSTHVIVCMKRYGRRHVLHAIATPPRKKSVMAMMASARLGE